MGNNIASCVPVCVPMLGESLGAFCTTGTLSNKLAGTCFSGSLASGSPGAVPIVCDSFSQCQVTKLILIFVFFACLFKKSNTFFSYLAWHCQWCRRMYRWMRSKSDRTLVSNLKVKQIECYLFKSKKKRRSSCKKKKIIKNLLILKLALKLIILSKELEDHFVTSAYLARLHRQLIFSIVKSPAELF